MALDHGSNQTVCENDCGCRCGCGHGSESGGRNRMILRLGAAFLLTVAAASAPLPGWLAGGFFFAAYLLAGFEVLLAAARNIGRGQLFDENFLMSLASLGAFAIGESAEAVAVMIFYGIGELLQNAAVARSQKNIESLIDLRSDQAHVKRDGILHTVAPETVVPGDIIVVKPGEKIPLDGEVLTGEAYLDLRALTGEAAPVHAEPGKTVYSGGIALDGLLEIRVSRPFAESTVSRILELVRHAAEKKSATERFITRFARWYTPGVVLLAAGLAVIPPLAGFGTFDEWVYRALSLLIISCPCALVLSIPLGFFGGIGGAARNGILVKGGNDLDALTAVGTVAFDKTGTLTAGVFEVAESCPAPGVDAALLLSSAAAAEAHSNHPIARSILNAYGRPPAEATEVREFPGMGVKVESAGATIYAGNARLMRQIGLEQPEAASGTTVHVVRDGRYLGAIRIADRLRDGVRATLDELRGLGVERLAMLTGDNRAAAEAVAAAAGLNLWRAELLPQDKVGELERLMATEKPGRKTVFVGDGINDAPVLARADLGIAMGGVGSDAAIEAADVVVMNDDLARIALAIRIARKTRRIVWQNILFALGCKGAILLLAVTGHVSVWVAIFADVGVALLAVANSMRALRSGHPSVP